jgi:hypothetical protein
MEALDNKYYVTLGKNISSKFDTAQCNNDEAWAALGKYAWMVSHFIEAESIRDAREAKNK